MSDTLAVSHAGEPLPCPRPRVVNGRTFMAPRYLAYRDGLSYGVLGAMRAQKWKRWRTGPMRLEVTFTRGTARVADIDNMVKTVMDSASSAGAWADDVQVVELHAFKVHERGAGSVVFTITTLA